MSSASHEPGALPSDPPRIGLVTGSSRGIGAAIARRPARDGLAVAVNALPGDPDIDVVVRDIERTAGTAGGFPADITDAAQVIGLVDAVTRTLGPIDTLVLIATGPQPEAPLTHVEWQQHLDQLTFFVKRPPCSGSRSSPG